MPDIFEQTERAKAHQEAQAEARKAADNLKAQQIAQKAIWLAGKDASPELLKGIATAILSQADKGNR